MQSREIFTLLFKELHLASWVFAIPVIIAVALFLQAPKEYEAAAKILVGANAEQVQSLTPQAADAGPQSTALEIVNSEVEFLKSRELAEKTVQAVGVQRLFPKLQRNADGSIDGDAAMAAFMKSLTVKPVAASHVIDLTFRGPNAEVATLALDNLLRFYKDMHDGADTGAAKAYLDGQIQQLDRSLANLNDRIDGVKRQNGLFDPDQERKDTLLNRANLSAAAMQLRAHSDELRAKTTAIETLRSKTPQSQQQYPLADESDAMVKARAQLLELKQQQVKLNQNYQPTSRAVRNNQAQIDGVVAILAAETARFEAHRKLGRNPIYDQLSTDLAQASTQITPDQAQASALDAEIAQIDRRLTQIDQVAATLTPLELQRASQIKTLDAMRERASDLSLMNVASAARPSAIKVIQKPGAALINKPVKPKGLAYLAGGVAAGAIACFIFLAAAFALKNTFLVPESVEAVTRVPVLVSLPVR